MAKIISGSEIPSKDEFDWENRFLSWCVHVE